MTDDFIRDTILLRLAEVAPETAEACIDPNADLRAQLDLDESDFWAYVAAVGDELGVEIPDSDLPMLSTIDGGVSYVSSRITR